MEGELIFNKQKFSKRLAADIALEIIYGCDRFDKYDVKVICASNNIDLEDMRKLTEEIVKNNYATGDETWNEDFLQKQLNYWFK